MQVLLYLLVFIFGFYTYKTFFVYRIASASLFMLRVAQKTSLLMLLKAIEHHSYARTFCISQLEKNNATKNNIDSFKIYMNNDVELLKATAIRDINKSVPSYFSHAIEFDDWESAMAFLNKNKEFVNLLNGEKAND